MEVTVGRSCDDPLPDELVKDWHKVLKVSTSILDLVYRKPK